MCKFVNSVGVTLNILKADKRAMPLMLAFPQEMVVLLLRLLLWSKDDCFVDTTRIPYCRFPQIQNPDRRLTLYECVTRIAMNYFFFGRSFIARDIHGFVLCIGFAFDHCMDSKSLKRHFYCCYFNTWSFCALVVHQWERKTTLSINKS